MQAAWTTSLNTAWISKTLAESKTECTSKEFLTAADASDLNSDIIEGAAAGGSLVII